MGAVLIQPGKIDGLAALPQLFGTVCPLVAGKADDRDGAQCCFFFQKFAAQKFADLPGILTVELIVSVLLKAYQRIRYCSFRALHSAAAASGSSAGRSSALL